MTRHEQVSTLPSLSPALTLHSERVLQAVRTAIRAAGGWLAFDDYLRIVQYAPGLGYYSAGSEKFGREGDFVTAPELSPLFGSCLARQCAQILSQTGGELLELGAGSGALAESLLSGLAELEQLPERYGILEVSAELRRRQQHRLAGVVRELGCRIEWLEALPSSSFTGVVLANEVADALPFKRFLLQAGVAYERGVALSPEDQLIEADRIADPSLQSEIERVTGWTASTAPDGYLSELCPLLEPWIAAIAATLGRGAVLLIDYGLSRRDYYHTQRRRGTLRCHLRHRAHEDPLLYPGLQDISAWADFTRVAEAASASGLEVSGYCTQAAFLLATGIEQQLAAVSAPIEHARLASQARVLLLPGEMGETFKVMALTRGFEPPLCGFAYQDLRGSL